MTARQDQLWKEREAAVRPAGAVPLPSFIGFYAVDSAGRAWLVVDAWREPTPGSPGVQATVGPDGSPGPTLSTRCAHFGPLANPPGWRERRC